MATADPKMLVRMPPEVKAFIEAAAKENMRSMTAEIIYTLAERMKREQSAA